MLDFNIYLGFVQNTDNKGDGKPYKPFVLDLSKFPSLFIDYNHKISIDEDMDPIAKSIMNICSSFYPEDRVKCVVIDGYSVAYNSIMKPGTYRHDARQTMIKRVSTYVSKIYEEYLRNPDDFVPRTRYIILVCRIGSMEKELISIMSKLGPIGVYLILADDAMAYTAYPDLFKNLYGILKYTDFCPSEGNSVIKYDPIEETNCEYPDPKFVYTLNRFRLQRQNYPTIYPHHFCKAFKNEPSPIKRRIRSERPKKKNILPKDAIIRIF